MPTPRPSLHSRALAACLAPSRAWLTTFAQALPTPPPATAAGSTKEEPLMLSPFEVGSDSERGYNESTAILQGGRGKIDLADVAGQVQVFTKDFLDDIGATTTRRSYSRRRLRRISTT